MIARRGFLAGTVAIGAAGLAAAKSGPGLTDTHVHLFGPHAKYPMSTGRPFTPPQAQIGDLMAFNQQHGITHTVVIQPSFYGTDNRLLVNALGVLGKRGAGVAVVAPDVSEGELASLRSAGVKGVRLNLESGGEREPEIARRRFDALSARLAGSGMHLQLFAHISVIDALSDRLAKCPIPLVIDHFGFPDPNTLPRDPAFRRLVALVGSGRAHVKLSAPWRIGGVAPEFETLKPLALAFADAAPNRLLWGSDWPHTQRRSPPEPERVVPFAKPAVTAWKATVARWLGPERWAAAAVVNPARLYEFNDNA